MNRVILTPAPRPASALGEIKQWLGITTARDDTSLSVLLAAALDTFEAFTGRMALAATCEEILPAQSGWTTLDTLPVTAITALEMIAADGTRSTLDPASHEIDLCADGTGRVRLIGSPGRGRIAVRFTAGIAPDWNSLPESLRHSIVRLAAHQHRARDEAATGGDAEPLPPASIAALWRPWRRLRLG